MNSIKVRHTYQSNKKMYMDLKSNNIQNIKGGGKKNDKSKKEV